MPKQLGRIGTVRRAIRGKACPLCGSYTYQLIVRSSSMEEDAQVLARCSCCERPRQLDDGFWKSLLDIKLVDHHNVRKKSFEVLGRYRARTPGMTVSRTHVYSGAAGQAHVNSRRVMGSKRIGIFERSIAGLADSSLATPVHRQVLVATWRVRWNQLVQAWGLSKAYARLQLCRTQLMEWLRRELALSPNSTKS